MILSKFVVLQFAVDYLNRLFSLFEKFCMVSVFRMLIRGRFFTMPDDVKTRITIVF